MAGRNQLVIGIQRIGKSHERVMRLQRVLTVNTANHMRQEEATA